MNTDFVTVLEHWLSGYFWSFKQSKELPSFLSLSLEGVVVLKQKRE